MSPLNVGIVGTGIFATDTHLPTFAQIDGINPAACYNRTRSKADAFAARANIPADSVYDSLEAIFTAPEVDFVDALLPVQHNVDAVRLAIAHGKPLAFEKPIAANLEQARQIVRLSAESTTPIAVLENWSFRNAIGVLTDKVLPQIGDIVSFTYHLTGPWNDNNKYLATAWRQNPEHIGGFLSDGGVHQLALLTDVLGPVATVSGLTRQVRPESGADDVLFLTMKLESGVIGTFTYGSAFGATAKSTSFTVYGTNGSAVYDFLPSLPQPTITWRTGTGSSSALEPHVLAVEETSTFVAEFENFAAAVRLGDKSAVRVPPAKAFHHLAIVAAALESSANSGAAVKVAST